MRPRLCSSHAASTSTAESSSASPEIQATASVCAGWAANINAPISETARLAVRSSRSIRTSAEASACSATTSRWYGSAAPPPATQTSVVTTAVSGR